MFYLDLSNRDITILLIIITGILEIPIKYLEEVNTGARFRHPLDYVIDFPKSNAKRTPNTL